MRGVEREGGESREEGRVEKRGGCRGNQEGTRREPLVPVPLPRSERRLRPPPPSWVILGDLFGDAR